MIQLHQCLVSGKRTVYKVLKSKSEEFRDLVLLGEGNVEDSLSVSREFLASLYDQKAKLRADYSNLNKFRVRLATKKEHLCRPISGNPHKKRSPLLGLL